MANNNPPPTITVTSSTTAPITHSVTTTTRLNGRRSRNANDGNTLTTTTSRASMNPSENNDNGGHLEPFPSMPAATPGLAPPTPGGDYFGRPPTQFQSRQRPISIRRLPSATEARRIDEENELQRTTSWLGVPRSGSRRRAGTAPSQQHQSQQGPPPATSGLAALPGHYELGRTATTANTTMQPLVEGEQLMPEQTLAAPEQAASEQRRGSIGNRVSQRIRSASNAARSSISRLSEDSQQPGNPSRDYANDVVDYLDVVDPEVSAMTTLTNIQNSLFVPDIPYLGRFVNRRPTFELTRGPSRISERPEPTPSAVARKPVPPTPPPPSVPPKDDGPEEGDLERFETVQEHPTTEAEAEAEAERTDETMPRPSRLYSITSHIDESHYAVLPHGVSLEGWTDEEREALDDYVRHMVHSRRSRFKQSMKAFGKYVRKPLGFFVTLYATLITLFGLAWVLFLIGWIYVGDRQSYIINIIDNVLVALFAIVGDGLAPFRAVDTYHMIYIAHYHRLSWRLRRKKALPKLQDHNDLPERTEKEISADAEAGLENESAQDWEFSVLTMEQQKKLVHHQNKFSKSHSYYRPHETTTHYAFPLKLLITIVSLLDLHSTLQISLGAFTWGWSYHHRPPAITATILSCSITVNILAGILITVGDHKTRKKDVLLRMARQDLTQQAMRKVQKHKEEGKDLSPNHSRDDHRVHKGDEDESPESSHQGSLRKSEAVAKSESKEPRIY